MHNNGSHSNQTADTNQIAALLAKLTETERMLLSADCLMSAV